VRGLGLVMAGRVMRVKERTVVRTGK